MKVENGFNIFVKKLTLLHEYYTTNKIKWNPFQKFILFFIMNTSIRAQ